MSRLRMIKPFSEVEVGKDTAFQSPWAGNEWDDEYGEILWKGKLEDLPKSEYSYLLDDWEDEEIITNDYNLVIADIEMYGATLFNYDEDPSGVVCFVDINVSIALIDYLLSIHNENKNTGK